jgi:hypothetical protein
VPFASDFRRKKGRSSMDAAFLTFFDISVVAPPDGGELLCSASARRPQEVPRSRLCGIAILSLECGLRTQLCGARPLLVLQMRP